MTVGGRECLTRVPQKCESGLMVKIVPGHAAMVSRHQRLFFFEQDGYEIGGKAFPVLHLLKKWPLDV